MRTIFQWTAPAVLFACVLGCSQDPPSAKKAPGPNIATPKPDATSAIAAANLVTLHVEGMV